MRFFVEDGKEIKERQGGNAAEHYFWCLLELSNDLNNARTWEPEIKTKCLENFKNNMRQTDITTKMLEETQPAINRLLNPQKNINKEDVLNTLRGLCIPQVGYITEMQL